VGRAHLLENFLLRQPVHAFFEISVTPGTAASGAQQGEDEDEEPRMERERAGKLHVFD
jgi:hypothetical protein